MKKIKLLILLLFVNSTITYGQNKLIPIHQITPKAGIEELNALKPYLAGRKLIGLGESTHGTSEFTTLRHSLFKYLVQEEGFNTVFLEEDYASCLRVDNYIKGSDDQLEEVILAFNQWPWKTKEMATLIEWMRAYNLENKSKQLNFIGVDLQYFHSTLKAIDSMLFNENLSLEAILFTSTTSDREFMQLKDTADLKEYHSIFNQRKAIVDTLDATFSIKTKLKHLLRSLEYIIEEKYNLQNAFYRDMRMADNILAHLKSKEELKGIYWAHNVHISISCPYEEAVKCRAGANLKNQLADNFYSIALDFDEGSFNAYYLNDEGLNPTKIENYTLGEVSVEEAIEGSIAFQYRDQYETALFIPSTNFQKRKERKLTGRIVGARFINYAKEGKQSYFEKYYSRNFDAIMLIKHTHATEILNDE